MHARPDRQPGGVNFGRVLRPLWYLDDELIYLNHGTVGATPKAVLAEQFEVVAEIERHPAEFILRQLSEHGPTPDPTKRIRAAAAAVAEFVGADPGDLVPVDNITTGANGVLRSFPLRAGDEIVTTSLGYGGITNAAIHAARVAGATHRVIELPLPGAPIERYIDATVAGLGPATRVLVVDHITSLSALVLPVAEICAAATARGIAVFVDGAHVPGNMALNISALGADYYSANLHKWAMAPRATGFLWIDRARHGEVRSPVSSWGLDNGIVAEFDLPGTRDPSAFLTAPFAIEWLAALGGPGGIEAVYERNHQLAWWAGHYLADRWDVLFSTPESMVASMVTVPLPVALGSTTEDAERVQLALAARRIEVPVFSLGNGCLSLRVSAAVYCDRADIEHLADTVLSLGHSTTQARTSRPGGS